eukprot:2518666-Prymnesium_polylepis.1
MPTPHSRPMRRLRHRRNERARARSRRRSTRRSIRRARRARRCSRSLRSRGPMAWNTGARAVGSPRATTGPGPRDRSRRST